MKNLLPFEREKRKIIVKKETGTSEKYGCRPEERPTEALVDYGIVNIDKPKGPTSHQVADYVKKILGREKAGHTGTLDPAVSGVLPVALGRATRISQLLLTAGKEYAGVMHIHKGISSGALKNAVNEFTGKINQLPPVRSAVKRQLRERNIYYFEINEMDDKDALFVVGCQAGTYIRKLVSDLGKKLGTGAHMAELRRTKAGPFNESSLVTLQELADAYHYWKEKQDEKKIRKAIQPVENGARHLPKIWAADSAVDSLCHGANLNIPGISKFESGIGKGDLVAVMTLKDELACYGISNSTSEMLEKQDKGFAVKIEKVFMKPGTYPRMQLNG